MTDNNELANRRVEHLLKLLDIPDSYYKLAEQRYHSIADWLCRPESAVAQHAPAISPQGSFLLGLVNRPVYRKDEYDLDIVAEMQRLTKTQQSQEALKQAIGDELALYAQKHSFDQDPTEKNRCWRLHYAGEPKFHMDLLPAVPEDDMYKAFLQAQGVPPEWAESAIAITDIRHPQYKQIAPDWLCSNPLGYAKWFKGRMRPQALPGLELLVKSGEYSTVDEIPTWRWKTPLQQAIQLMKRHRDVMFKDKPKLRPISMIITTLAAHAYNGETTVYEALAGIAQRMPDYIRRDAPRIPNPTNPKEDFADAWSDSRLISSFWGWYEQLKADVAALGRPLSFEEIQTFGIQKMQTPIEADAAMALSNKAVVVPFIAAAPKDSLPNTPVVKIQSPPPKPWSRT